MQGQFVIEDGVLISYEGMDTEILIPEGIHTIGDGAFKGMAGLISISLPTSLKKIGATAFKGCRQLHEISFPEGLVEIGEYAFHRCHKIEKMIFPDSMTLVGNYAFLYCDGLREVVMKGPGKLGRAVFSHNLSLREITLNKELDDSNFSDEVFEGCVHIEKITLSDDTYEISNLIDAMNSHSDYPKIIQSIAKSVYHSLQIEDGVLKSFNINLKSVLLPEGITAIGKACFFDKKGIVNLTLPKSLREIKANAFLNCFGLEEITFQNEEIILDDKAFRGCNNLKQVHLPDGSYSIEENLSNKLVNMIKDQVLGDFYISGKTMIRYMGKEEQIQIPKGVEIIGERCFYGKEQLRTVQCPDSLVEIREQAFEGCVTLQNIVLPEGLKRVEREAFAECKKLLKCNIPESLEYIGEYAFRRCFVLQPFETWPKQAVIHPYAFYRAKHFAKMEELLRCKAEEASAMEENRVATLNAKMESTETEIPAYAHAREKEIKILKLTGVKRIGKYAYASCPELEEIFIDAPDCVIDQKAFNACPKLKRVYLHVKELGKGTFAYCRELEEVRLSGVTVLPAESFAGCYALSSFEAKEIREMEARCFDECIHLHSFDFKEIRMIGERAFERCDSLKNVELDQVECGYHAFADCASLETVTISDNTTLKSGAFIGCTQIHTVYFDGRKYEFDKFLDCINHVGNLYPIPVRELIASIYSCFDIVDRKILTGYSQDATVITIPQDMEEVGQDVFRDHIRLRKINIPASVKIFGSHAFSMTTWIEEQRGQSEMVIVNKVLLDGAMCKGKVVIPSDVRRIASWSFAGNTEITELVIPSDWIGIESLSFRNCLNLKKITDWNGNEYVLNDVSDLTDKTYPELIGRIFTECINCFKLDEEHHLIESTGNITKLVFPEGIKAVGDGVYKDCHLLERITFSSDTESIGKSAFENSKWLKAVLNAKNVSSIGSMAFSGCQSLESIDLTDRLTELGSRCFEHCCSLKEIYLSDKLERIPERAFFRCKSLKRIIIPESVKVIEKEAFAFCDGLEEVYVPEHTQVDENAFAFCEHVKIEKG